MNIICTYFFQEHCNSGSSYGNISLDFLSRNEAYWKTVYCLFYTAVISNNDECSYVLVTNVAQFPFRKKIESLGVIIFDNVDFTHANSDKWFAVKYFFDVIDFIEQCDFFSHGDSIVLLDTDCVAINNASSMFNTMTAITTPQVYLNNKRVPKDSIFHGVTIADIELFYYSISNERLDIQDTVGGEFFLYKKGFIDELNAFFKLILSSDTLPLLTTEEQILTLANAKFGFRVSRGSISRVWTTLRTIRVPDFVQSFIFLHLPSEKTYSLPLIFDILSNKSPVNESKKAVDIVFNVINLRRPLIYTFNKYIDIYFIKIFKEKLLRITR